MEKLLCGRCYKAGNRPQIMSKKANDKGLKSLHLKTKDATE